MENLFKALGDVNRLRILNILIEEEPCVCELEVVLALSQSNASRHLGKLKSAGLVESYRDAQWAHYRLSPQFSRDHDPLIRYLADRFRLDPVYRHDAKRFRRYRNSSYDCQSITCCRDAVVEYLATE